MFPNIHENNTFIDDYRLLIVHDSTVEKNGDFPELRSN